MLCNEYTLLTELIHGGVMVYKGEGLTQQGHVTIQGDSIQLLLFICNRSGSVLESLSLVEVLCLHYRRHVCSTFLEQLQQLFYFREND